MGTAVAKRLNAMSSNADNIDTVIIGLGKTGLSCVRHLAPREPGLAVLDSRAAPPGLERLRAEFPDVPVTTGPFDAALLERARRIILSPGVAPTEPALRAAAAAGVEITGDIELFARAAAAPVVAVTGSNGKGTVATLVAEMIRGSGRRVLLGGNIGTPALELLAQPVPDLYVLELSSFQLDLVQSLNAAAAAVLNVSADHLDRYADLEHYAASKARIYAGDGVMVLNADDRLVSAMALPGRRAARFSLSPPADGDYGLVREAGGDWLCAGARRLLPAADLHIPGAHNVANVLAAMALGDAVGLPGEAMCRAASAFRGLPHRCRLVTVHGGVAWYNDSKGTNVGAACAAIRGLQVEGGLILIAGGEGKGADFAPLGEAARGRVRHAILIGRDAHLIADALAGVETIAATGMEAAVSTAARLARPGDAVLLSPACASFDMFENYEHRGDVFEAAVRAHAAGGRS